MRMCEGLGVRGTLETSEEIWRFPISGDRRLGLGRDYGPFGALPRAPSCQNKDRILHSGWGAVQRHKRCWWAVMALGSH